MSVPQPSPKYRAAQCVYRREACDVLRSVECERDCWLVIDDFQSLNAGLSPSFLIALWNTAAQPPYSYYNADAKP